MVHQGYGFFKQLEGGLVGLLHHGLHVFVAQFIAEIVRARTPALGLDEFRGGKNGSHQRQIENVRTVVAGGHHADSNADTWLPAL